MGSDLDKIDAFLEAEMAPTPEAIGASIKSAAAVGGTIASVDTQLLAVAMTREDGSGIRQRLSDLLSAEELATPLAPALRALTTEARTIVYTEAPPSTVAPPTAARVPSDGGAFAGAPGARVSDAAVVAVRHNLNRQEALKELDELRARLEATELGEGPFDIEVRSHGGTQS